MILRILISYASGLFVPTRFVIPVVGLLGLRSRGRRFDRALVPVLCLAALLGWVDRRATMPEPLHGESPVRVRGWIASSPVAQRHTERALLAVESIDGLPEDLDFSTGDDTRLLVWSRTPLPVYGARLELEGRLRPPRAPSNFDAYDEGVVLLAQRVSGVLRIDSFRVLPGRRGPAWRREILEPLRARLGGAIARTLAPEEAGLLEALLLGWRHRLDPEIATSWRALGLVHLLCISGMHVGLVAGAVLLVVGPPHRRRGLVGLLFAVWGYAALGGFGPSVLRAGCMATWTAVSLGLGRRPRALRALGLASLALVLTAPEKVHSLALQLSCLATAGVLLWAPALVGWARSLAERGHAGRLLAWIAPVAALGIGAQMATLPLLLRHFGMVSWCAPIANLVFVPLTHAALVLGLVGAPLVLLGETLGRPLLLLSGALLHAAQRLALVVTGSIETRFFATPDPPSVLLGCWIAVTFLLAGCTWTRVRRGISGVLLGLSCLGCVGLVWHTTHPRFPAWQLDALDVGQGDALVLVLGPDAWLVDAGDTEPVDRGARVVVPHLRRLGIQRLRGLVISHPHRDHTGGAASVLRAVAVDTLYLARAWHLDPAYDTLRAVAASVPVRWLQQGDVLELGPGYRARTLWPPASDALGSGPNGCSLVLWAQGNPHPDLLLMGDLESDGEERVLEAWPELERESRRFLVLKAGHHGSRTSSTRAFLRTTDPELAIVSAGRRNRYGHPDAQTLAALVDQGCAVFRTDRAGAVRLVQRGKSLWLERPASRLTIGKAPFYNESRAGRGAAHLVSHGIIPLSLEAP